MRHTWLLPGFMLLAGCASTVAGFDAQNRPVTMHVGFGNRVTTPGFTVEPSEAVTGAAERVATFAMQTAPEAIARIAAQKLGETK